MDFVTSHFGKMNLCTLTSWTLLQHICTIAITPKSEDKYFVKVFNWSEVHLSEMTCYKIHTLVVLNIEVGLKFGLKVGLEVGLKVGLVVGLKVVCAVTIVKGLWVSSLCLRVVKGRLVDRLSGIILGVDEACGRLLNGGGFNVTRWIVALIGVFFGNSSLKPMNVSIWF